MAPPRVPGEASPHAAFRQLEGLLSSHHHKWLAEPKLAQMLWPELKGDAGIDPQTQMHLPVSIGYTFSWVLQRKLAAGRQLVVTH
jgi:hypothetical protein